jgi:uncharacterized membrane-anchored protein
MVMFGLSTAALPAGHTGTTFGTLTDACREQSTPDTFKVRAAVKCGHRITDGKVNAARRQAVRPFTTALRNPVLVRDASECAMRSAGLSTARHG